MAVTPAALMPGLLERRGAYAGDPPLTPLRQSPETTDDGPCWRRC